jgi:chromosome segregation ATPase
VEVIIMEKKLEIKKLADVVVWADNEIEEIKNALYEEEFENCDEAKDLEVVKKVVLEAINRHNTYTNALNKDIADKEAKIELLEKELEGRKEGYTALKELIDTKYISIEEHNKICKKNNDTIEDYEEEIASLNTQLKVADDLRMHKDQDIIRQAEALRERDAKIEKLEKELEHRRNMTDDENCVMNSLYDEIARRTEKINELTIKVTNQKKNLDGINKTLEIRNKENESLIQVRNNMDREIEAHEAENKRLTEKIKELRDLANVNKNTIDYHYEACEKLKKKIAELEKENGDYAIRVNNLTKELEKTYAEKEADLKNHNRRDMNLVDELAGKNDKIKGLVEEIEYYKSQEHIRTDQLRATESKVEQLYKEIEQLKYDNSYLTKASKNKNDIIRKAYVRYVDEACKGREEIMNECYKKLTKDDTGYQGFKQYTLRALEAEKGNEEKAKEFIDCAASIIFYNKKAEEKRKEETKKELNEAFGVPCGEDSIE